MTNTTSIVQRPALWQAKRPITIAGRARRATAGGALFGAPSDVVSFELATRRADAPQTAAVAVTLPSVLITLIFSC
jgi:hypothetical protein